MQSQVTQHKPASYNPRWSNRILIAAAVGIFFLTLFPFRIVFHSGLPGRGSPFFLGGGAGKDVGPLDAFLNVLLFVPFGFGLAEKLRERGKPRAAIVALVLVAGALLSYGIEFLQFYIPGRDSGWEDVLTNGTGAAVGSLLFDTWGGALLGFLSQVDAALGAFLTWRRAVLTLVVYFACWFAISAHLQKQTRLSNWDPHCRLTVGNDAAGQRSTGWQGEVFELQLWDRALPDAFATALTAGITPNDTSAVAVATYVFTGSPPFRDRMKSLPELSWASGASAPADPNELVLDGKSSLASEVPASDLVADFQRTNQFAVRVVCRPAETIGSDGRIVSLSRSSGLVNLVVRQEDANLVLWFRNPLSVKHALLAWYVPNVFATSQRHDILYSYDGSNVSLFIDGKREPHVYRLGPGTGLARLFQRVKPVELDGYADIYYAGVFFPAGVLLGIAARRLGPHSVTGWLSLAFCLLVPPWLLERLLMSVSGRFFSLHYVVLSLVLLCGGALWINADRRPEAGAE
jgi:hypothetical protein